MQQDTTGVRYAIRCGACGYRGDTRRPDGTYHGEAVLCPRCGEATGLEWDESEALAGLTPGFAGDPLGPGATRPADKGPAPTAEALRQLRLRHGRTQVDVAACVGVTERQVQRWEAGQGSMPIASWQLLRRVWGARFTEDFAPAPALTRDWDYRRDAPRDTIERGDVVELQPRTGPRLRAIVTTVSSDASRAERESDGYGAIVVEFVDAPGAEEFAGFCLGERVSFARANVIHLEQRAPRG
ncbi:MULTISPECIES: helix-turn-helix domain-containing protein [Burkholderia]|uniref:helix-turn-helix domain-containing protein n=1 Tax=Burkholderia TaxID=32008 RepID=UPI000052DD84|nr:MULTISPECIES: helix-turn-helix transcriptional regulator [Burkholderia]ABK13610.1 transcriptional regulator, XRE family [Burkholderia cenocepacia HI2424]MCF1371652.1 helix-turn-helix domain-containing protein [Burkholderia cenocepacia]MCF1389165.1 helix-turn-helix domain-containing protein [Burkholderia cenocepacia]MCG0578294.1 helix-turn-helix domain-containing protein [Burkholderia cenocepacia]MCW3639515.1 helix-turn-helix domain-containing protein [Burkholderia cenocepacia]